MKTAALRFVLIVWLPFWLLGCASGLDRPTGSAAAQADMPKQLRARQIIVTLADATPEQWAATALTLSETYQLREAGNFPLNSIRVQCLVYDVPEDRPLDQVIEPLKRDPELSRYRSIKCSRA